MKQSQLNGTGVSQSLGTVKSSLQGTVQFMQHNGTVVMANPYDMYQANGPSSGPTSASSQQQQSQKNYLQKPAYISIANGESKEIELDGSSRFDDDFEANDRSQPASNF